MPKLNHLNYCRDIAAQFTKDIATEHPLVAKLKQSCLSQLADAQKFILPDGGELHTDRALKALDESEPLHLPFPTIALEYERSLVFLDKHTTPRLDRIQPPKTVILASHAVDDADENLPIVCITPIIWDPNRHTWLPLPPVSLNNTDYLNRDGVRISINMRPSRLFQIPSQDYLDELTVLLSFLNILQCSNVDITASPVSAVRKAIATRKQALPYDSYHILTIGNSAPQTKSIPTGTHRSPREHLRRGHIRRLPTGRRVWVNATVVAANSTGHITKTYAVGAP